MTEPREGRYNAESQTVCAERGSGAMEGKSRLRLVAFDMDGTLVDSMYYWDRAPACVLAARGIIPDDEMEEAFHQLGYERIPAYVAERFPALGPPEDFIARMDRWMLRRYQRDVLVKPNVPEYLSLLRKKRVRCAILTASDIRFAEAMLRRFQLEPYFEAVFSGRQLGVKKSDPAVYDLVLASLACAAENCTLFDDSPYAVQVAAEAGLRTVGILDRWFPHKHEALRQVCDRTASRYSELLANDVFSVCAGTGP